MFFRLEHGTTYTIVVTHPVDLGGKIRKVRISLFFLIMPFLIILNEYLNCF